MSANRAKRLEIQAYSYSDVLLVVLLNRTRELCDSQQVTELVVQTNGRRHCEGPLEVLLACINHANSTVVVHERGVGGVVELVSRCATEDDCGVDVCIVLECRSSQSS